MDLDFQYFYGFFRDREFLQYEPQEIEPKMSVFHLFFISCRSHGTKRIFNGRFR